MALKSDIRGMIWRYADYFVVGREELRRFAESVQCDHRAHFEEDAAAELGYDAIVAPLTFVSIFVIALFVVALLMFVPAINIGSEKPVPLEALSPLED